MFRDAFTKLDLLENEALLPQVNPLLEGSHFDPRTATALIMDLPFYPGHRLLDLSDHTVVPARHVHAVYAPDQNTLQILNWTNVPIYALNRRIPILLNDRTVVDYIRFFFTFVRGRHGRFLIVESADDIAWKDEPPPAARKAIGNLIDPVRLRGIDDKGHYMLTVRMIFKDSLFKATVHVTTQGDVTLSDEDLVVEDMPVLDDVLGA